MKCVLEAWDKLGVPTMIVMIDTPDEKVDKKHPFPSSLTLPLYNTLFEDYKEVEGIILSKNADIVAIGESLYNMGYEICCWTCGTDRYDSYKKMSTKYKEKSHLTDDFQLMEIKRTNEDISATKVRECLLDDKYIEFSELMPFFSLKTHLKVDLYNTLRNQLLKAYEDVYGYMQG